jgi:hypothetical protein
MGSLYNNTHFTFNTTGMIGSVGKPLQLFIDDEGKIINRNKIEYGVYNKIFNFEFKKVLIIKKHSIGFGDIIDKITTITKIKDLIIYLTKGNCGCEARRIKFNKWFKIYWFTIKFRQIYSDDYNIIPKQKTLVKNIIPVEYSRTEQEHRKVIQTQKPVTQAQVKKSCNCGAKR